MNAELIPLQQAVVIRGQRAWGKIKATAAEQRQLWREVGEALNYGRTLHSSNQAFGKWCREQGFDMDAPTRSDAMWFASYHDGKTEVPPSLTHPKIIRQWHRDHADTLPPSLDLSDRPAPALLNMVQVEPIARKVKALAAMAERGTGQEAETAKRHLKRKAADLGMSPEELTDTAQRLDPAVTPAARETFNGVLDGIRQVAGLYLQVLLRNKELGLTPELIALNVYNALKDAEGS